MILRLLILSGLLTAGLTATAQPDSARALSLKAIQFDFGFHPSYPRQMSQEQFRRVAPRDPHTNVNIEGFETSRGFSTDGTGFFVSARAIHHTKNLYRFTSEVNIGLMYSKSMVASLNYFDQGREVVDVYQSTSNEPQLVKYRFYNTSGNYQISCHNFFVPVSYMLSTKQDRMIWISTGIEIGAGISAGYRYKSVFRHQEDDVFVEAGTDPSTARHFFIDADFSAQQEHSEMLGGVGFTGIATLPMRLYLHPFTKLRGFKLFHAYAELGPAAMWRVDPKVGNSASVYLRAACGLRISI